MSQLADLAAAVLAAERDLGLRAGQAGIDWTQVARLLPDASRARVSAADLSVVSKTVADGGDQLAQFEVARPTPRTQDPLTELGDRILRLRHHAWETDQTATRRDRPPTDFAAAGVIVHAHIAAHLGAKTSADPGELPPWSMARRAQEGRATGT